MDISLLHRKEQLIITAIEIIDELGIQKLTTREIARRQGVSEGTLFRHYNSKNELILAVLDHFSKFDEDIYQSTRLKKLKPEEAILFFISSFVEYYENYPAITSIMYSMDVLRFEPELADKLKEIINNRNKYIKQLIDDAQESNVINAVVDSEDLVCMISGFFQELCFKWRLDERNFSLKERMLLILKVFLEALKTN